MPFRTTTEPPAPALPATARMNPLDPLPLNLEEANTRALDLLEKWLLTKFREEIESDKWQWPTPPKLRDIVNTGKLRDSAVVLKLPGGGFEIRYTVNYATSAHEGGKDPETGLEYPGRPWTKEALAQLGPMYAHFMGVALKEQAVQAKANDRARNT